MVLYVGQSELISGVEQKKPSFFSKLRVIAILVTNFFLMLGYSHTPKILSIENSGWVCMSEI